MYNEPAETFGHNGWKVEIWFDECAQNPREEFGTFGTIAHLHREYDLGDLVSEEDIQELIESNKVIWLPVFLLDHSGLWLSTGDFSSCDPGGWDSGQVGIIYVSRERVEKEFGRGTEAIHKARELLKAEVETFSHYLTGNVYGFKLIHPDTGEEENSCWGFYGAENVLEEAKSAADHSAPHTWLAQLIERGNKLASHVYNLKSGEANDICREGLEAQAQYILETADDNYVQKILEEEE